MPAPNLTVTQHASDTAVRRKAWKARRAGTYVDPDAALVASWAASVGVSADTALADVADGYAEYLTT